MHEEIEGACAAGSGSMIEEASGVNGEDGPGSAPSGPVAGILAVSDAASDGFEGPAAEGVTDYARDDKHLVCYLMRHRRSTLSERRTCVRAPA